MMGKKTTESSSTVHDAEEDEQCFSDDSSFLGDDETKAALEDRSRRFDPSFYWEHVHPYSTQVLLAKPYTMAPPKATGDDASTHSPKDLDRKQVENERLARLKRKRGDDDDAGSTTTRVPSNPRPELMEVDQKESTPFHNLYEGDPMAKQLDETLDDFLQRLQPSKTRKDSGPWIWIANPRASNKHIYRDQPRFVDDATALMEVYTARKRGLEEESPTAAAATITKKLKPEREWLEDSLVELAKKCGMTNGKWMLFPRPNDVDRVWATVAKGTLEGRLGSLAKVAANTNDGKAERLICVYTEDFTDVHDVKRVLKEMIRLGLATYAKWIYYKTDAYTYLGIKSDNEYKLKASKYNSKDMLSEIDHELM